MENKHRHIKETAITEDLGIVYFFDDESHTYVEPETAKNLITQYIEICLSKLIKYDKPY